MQEVCPLKLGSHRPGLARWSVLYLQPRSIREREEFQPSPRQLIGPHLCSTLHIAPRRGGKRCLNRKSAFETQTLDVSLSWRCIQSSS